MAERTKLRQARKSRGLTQEQLAERIGVKDRTTIGRWETGAREPQLETRPPLAKELRVTLDQLEEMLLESREPEPVRGPQGGDAVPLDSMRRRTLMKSGVAAIAATGLAVGVEIPDKIEMRDVRKLRRATDRLCASDHQSGGETFWQAGMAEIKKATLSLERSSCTAAVGKAYLLATGNMQLRTGWLACDAGELDVAHTCFQDALTVARQARDGEIEARALAALGFRSNLMGMPGEGLRLSQAADDAVASLGPASRMTAAPLLHLAVANARSQDARGADAAISRARKALDADRGTEVAGWAAFMTSTEIDGVEATCAVDLGQAARAEKLFESVIAEYDGRFTRNIALYQVRQATARVKSGAVDGAVETVGDVLTAIDEGLESWRVNLELDRVMGAIRSHRAPGVDTLMERYREVLAAR